MGPQRRLEIYVGFESRSIIKYLEPLTKNIFTARFTNCQFDESIFPELRGEKQLKRKVEFSWNASSLSHYDPRTNQSEVEVQRMIHLQNITNQLPDAFIDTKKVTRSHIPAANTLARIIVPKGKSGHVIGNECKACQKHGRPIGSRDKVSRMRKEHVKTHGVFKTLEEFDAPEETIFS